MGKLRLRNLRWQLQRKSRDLAKVQARFPRRAFDEQRYRKNRHRAADGCQVLVSAAPYLSLSRFLAKDRALIRVVIADEAHQMKNPAAWKTIAFKNMLADARFALTGELATLSKNSSQYRLTAGNIHLRDTHAK